MALASVKSILGAKKIQGGPEHKYMIERLVRAFHPVLKKHLNLDPEMSIETSLLHEELDKFNLFDIESIMFHYQLIGYYLQKKGIRFKPITLLAHIMKHSFDYSQELKKPLKNSSSFQDYLNQLKYLDLSSLKNNVVDLLKKNKEIGPEELYYKFLKHIFKPNESMLLNYFKCLEEERKTPLPYDLKHDPYRDVDVLIKLGNKSFGFEVEMVKNNFLSPYVSKVLFFPKFVDQLFMIMPKQTKNKIDDLKNLILKGEYLLPTYNLYRARAYDDELKKVFDGCEYSPVIPKDYYMRHRTLFNEFRQFNIFKNITDSRREAKPLVKKTINVFVPTVRDPYLRMGLKAFHINEMIKVMKLKT